LNPGRRVWVQRRSNTSWLDSRAFASVRVRPRPACLRTCASQHARRPSSLVTLARAPPARHPTPTAPSPSPCLLAARAGDRGERDQPRPHTDPVVSRRRKVAKVCQQIICWQKCANRRKRSRKELPKASMAVDDFRLCGDHRRAAAAGPAGVAPRAGHAAKAGRPEPSRALFWARAARQGPPAWKERPSRISGARHPRHCRARVPPKRAVYSMLPKKGHAYM
jgi:hypothetical protein